MSNLVLGCLGIGGRLPGWVALAVLTWGAGGLRAQAFTQGESGQGYAHPIGVHLYSVSAYVGDYSSPLAFGALQPGAANAPGGIGMGGAASFGWYKPKGKFHWSAGYTISYTGSYNYPELNSLNHAFSISGTRRSNKWSFELSASGGVSSLSNYLFAPPVLAQLTALPLTFDELAAGVLNGVYSNDELASILTGTPPVEAAARTLFYGNRVLTSSLASGLSYARSTRFSVTFGAAGSRFENLSQNNAAGASAYVLPQTTSASGSVGISYSLTPRTQFGTEVSASRSFSRYTDIYYSTVSASLGRTLSRRWFARASLGTGIERSLRQVYALPSSPQVVASATLGFKTYEHTFLGSYSRTLADPYAFGASNSTSIGGSWQWTRPGRSWATNITGSQQQLTGYGFATIRTYTALATFRKQISRGVSLGLSYAYMRYNGLLITVPNGDVSVHGGTVAIIWSPRWGIL